MQPVIAHYAHVIQCRPVAPHNRNKCVSYYGRSSLRRTRRSDCGQHFGRMHSACTCRTAAVVVLVVALLNCPCSPQLNVLVFALVVVVLPVRFEYLSRLLCVHLRRMRMWPPSPPFQCQPPTGRPPVHNAHNLSVALGTIERIENHIHMAPALCCDRCCCWQGKIGNLLFMSGRPARPSNRFKMRRLIANTNVNGIGARHNVFSAIVYFPDH